MTRGRTDHPEGAENDEGRQLVPRPLVQATSQFEAEQICERLRAAGIKCGWRDEVEPTSYTWGGLSGLDDRFEVYVDELDLESARQALEAG